MKNFNSRNMIKLIYVGFAFMHHKGTNAGYHHLLEYLPYDKVFDCQKEVEWPDVQKGFFGKNLVRILWHLNYPFNMWVMVRCIIYNFFHNNCIFHFIYGENTYRWMKFFLRKSNRIVCTFHQPFSWFDNAKWRKRLSGLDGIILMADDEIDKFQKVAPKAKICFIPHGINTEFYHEGQQTRKKQVLMVGNWLRKFDFANEVFQRVLADDENLHVVVVTKPANQKFFQAHPRLTFCSGISDEKLRDLYLESQCLFLPLEAYTANNAVLEAASTNCPIIISTDAPSESYLNEDMIKLIPLDIDCAVECIQNNVEANADTRNYVVKHFSWQVVAERTQQFMNDLVIGKE